MKTIDQNDQTTIDAEIEQLKADLRNATNTMEYIKIQKQLRAKIANQMTYEVPERTTQEIADFEEYCQIMRELHILVDKLITNTRNRFCYESISYQNKVVRSNVLECVDVKTNAN